MTIETKVYKLLINDLELASILNELRGRELEIENVVHKHVIPDIFIKKENAPFIRLNPIFEGDNSFFDDEAYAEEQRIQISFWCKSDVHSEIIKNQIDKVLKSNGLTRYTSNENPRYKDSDIDLLMNVRKYRFFDWEN